jgi:hypothetical protein
MPDSWEFALQHAAGSFVTFLSDDDAIHPRLLSRVVGILHEAAHPVIAWPFGAIYHHVTSPNVAKRNVLEISQLRGTVTVVMADEVFATLSQAGFTHALPRMINSLCSQTVIASVRTKSGFPSGSGLYRRLSNFECY